MVLPGSSWLAINASPPPRASLDERYDGILLLEGRIEYGGRPLAGGYRIGSRVQVLRMAISLEC